MTIAPRCRTFDANANPHGYTTGIPTSNSKWWTKSRSTVVRLDTFLERQGVATVDRLEIDAQGEDLRVVESLGDAHRAT